MQRGPGVCICKLEDVPAKQIRFGKEEQRNERTLTFCKKVGASDMQLAPTW